MPDRLRGQRAVFVALTLLVAVAVGFGARALLSGEDEPPKRVAPRLPATQLRGFQYTAWFDDDERTIARRLDEIRAAGGNVVRVPFVWPLYEPHPDQVDTAALGRFEAFVDAAGRRGLKVIWLLGGTPCEYAQIPDDVLAQCRATPGANRISAFITWPPANEDAYRNGLRLVLDRVGDRLAAAEVWNEPNDPAFLRTRGDRVKDYVRIVRWSAAEIHKRAPGLPVLAGALARADAFFLVALYQRGLAGVSDGIAVHPYSLRPGDGEVATRPGAITFDADRATAFRSGIVAIHQVMTAFKEGRKPIWITEFGSRPCRRGVLCAGSERVQADWGTEAFVAAARLPYVAATVMHELVDSDKLGFGALRKNGTRRPVFDAILRAPRILAAHPRPGTALMPGCRPEPFGPCFGRKPSAASIAQALPAPGHSYRVRLACGPARERVVDGSGRRVATQAGLAFSAGCAQHGQQLAPADGPQRGARRATIAFVAPGSRLMRAADGGLPGRAHVVAIAADQALLRANTTDAGVALRTNALAEQRRGSDLVLGCTRGFLGRERSAWPGIALSACDTSATVHMSAPGVPDRIAVPEDRDVREVVWDVACPAPCDPEGGPFAARIALTSATLTVEEDNPPSVAADVAAGKAKITVADLMGVDRIEVRAGGRRLALHDTDSCRPSAGAVLSTRVPCPRDADRRVTLDVTAPASGTLEVTATDALGNVARRSVDLS